jgi:pentatricopeptide repeat protein
VNRGARSGQTCFPRSRGRNVIPFLDRFNLLQLELELELTFHPNAPEVGPFTPSQARGYTGNSCASFTILRWYYFAANSPEFCITMYQSGTLLKHPLPQERSKRYPGRPPSKGEVERANGTKVKPWSFRQHTLPLSVSGAGSLNLKLGQSVDAGRPVELVETLKEMKECGFRPDILTYNSVMELFGKHALEDEAWALMDDMKALGIMPDVETYKFLLKVR